MRRFTLNLCLFIACSLATAAAQYSTGQNIVAMNSTSITSDGSFLDANQFSGADICAKINAAFTALGAANSGTIDARGITGTQFCSSSPFTSPTIKRGKLLLGNVDIITSVQWLVPGRITVEGIGTTGTATSSTFNTLIQACVSNCGTNPSFPSNTALVVMGNTNPSLEVGVRSLTLDCAYVSGCTGIFNNAAQEGSTVQDVIIQNAPNVGLHVSTNATSSGAANSGPYRNITVQFLGSCASCGPGTVGVQVDGTNSGVNVREFDAITVSAFNATGNLGSSADGVLIFGVSTAITNSHVEWFPVAVEIGGSATNNPSGYATNNVQLSNISIANNQTQGVDIGNTNTVGDIVVIGIGTVNGKTLNDPAVSRSVTDTNLALYVRGHGTTPTILSTATNFSEQLYGNLNITGTLSKGGGTFKIDDPIDPLNKYLYHSFVESPDMMNVYNGTTRTGADGIATVTLPQYFEALNRDYRYQLTPIGRLARVTIRRQIKNNQFTIQSDLPGTVVSWQVTGIRQDHFANTHRIQVEEDKPVPEKGRLLHPTSSNE